MRGMTIAAGLFEVVFARAIRRLGFLFPPEITGLVVLMVSVSLVPLGASKFLGITYPDEPIAQLSPAIAAATLLTMIGINVWSRGTLRLYSVLIGMIAGYGLSMATGLFGREQLADLARSPWIAIPQIDGMLDVSFSWTLLPAFLIVSITGALKSMGNLTMCEKVNDANWKAPDSTASAAVSWPTRSPSPSRGSSAGWPPTLPRATSR